MSTEILNLSHLYFTVYRYFSETHMVPSPFDAPRNFSQPKSETPLLVRFANHAVQSTPRNVVTGKRSCKNGKFFISLYFLIIPFTSHLNHLKGNNILKKYLCNQDLLDTTPLHFDIHSLSSRDWYKVWSCQAIVAVCLFLKMVFWVCKSVSEWIVFHDIQLDSEPTQP